MDRKTLSAGRQTNSDILVNQSAISPASVRHKKETSNTSGSNFDHNALELQRTWSSSAKYIYCINSYPNGITLSVHNRSDEEKKEGIEENKKSHHFKPNQFHLRFRDTREYQLPNGKYFLYKQNFAQGLEHHLSNLYKSGKLTSSVFYFGTISDPFLAFPKKLGINMAILQLFEQYKPNIIVQTRSPMVVAALPTLKYLAERAVVAIPIESPLENVIARYTPGQPKVSQRLIAADGLRRQGVKVNLVASPMLPYGHPRNGAREFAEVLNTHADYITFGCLASGSSQEETQLKTLPIARKLVADKNFHWLRPHAYQHVYEELKKIAPEKLLIPIKGENEPAQLSLFAA